jgi:hypothetical protein
MGLVLACKSVVNPVEACGCAAGRAVEVDKGIEGNHDRYFEYVVEKKYQWLMG